ncbi:sialidase family protein [Aquimarina agarilytica]|uniref:sialidase family protein n=1 Tax=Aquimarina agarilytica TaxID=1087449 RepID=UPI0002898C66|nr:sialidase family protein [Aquimarina agarilytica]
MNQKLLYILLTSICLGCVSKKKLEKNKNTIYTKVTPKNVKIYAQTNKKSLGPCEPSICIDPTNPNNIVAASVLDYIHTSKDGGLTWTTKKQSSSHGIWGDPAIVADTKGDFYYFHLSDPEGTNWKSKKILDRIVIQKSNDKGITWTSGKGIGLNPPKQQDKQWACVNPKNNHLYTTWTEFDNYNSKDPNDKSRILFSKSNDYGNTWSYPKNISIHEGDCMDDDYTTEGAVPSTDGENIYIAWAFDHHIWFTKSSDGGNTWLTKPTKIAPQKSGWRFTIPGVKRSNGFPVTGVDTSNSQHKGTIYINWSDQTAPNNTDIVISKSEDQGKTWSAPQIIHKNNNPKHHFFNWMSIDPSTGFIYIVYYEEDAVNKSLVSVQLAVSKNGAKSFKNYTISEQSFDPKGANFFGDYNNIDALNGMIRPIWTQVENGLVSVWTALVKDNELK